jgi:hypothetical protein
MKLLVACPPGQSPPHGDWDEVVADRELGTSFLATDADTASRREAWDAAHDLITHDHVSWAGVEGIVMPGHPLSSSASAVAPCLPDSSWARKHMRQPQALRLLPAQPDQVVIGQPDTGWAVHYQLPRSALDLARARNAFTGGTDAEDPVEPNDPFDGHGTCTSSLLVSGEHDQPPLDPGQPDPLVGYCMSDTVVPIRCATNVVQFSTIALIWSIEYLTRIGVDIITISLGGLPSAPLQAAVRQAVDRNIIVVAAGGHSFPVVPYPAAYSECLAVAASTPNDRPWMVTTASPVIDISAPGHLVCVADFVPPGRTQITKAGSGTSYAAPAVAAAAALWIAKWGRSTLRAKYKNAQPLQYVFKQLLQQTARVPKPLDPPQGEDARFVDFVVPLTSWRKDRYGAGIVDMEALLQAALPPATRRPTAVPISPIQHDLVALGHTLGVSPKVAARVMTKVSSAPDGQRPVSLAETVDILLGAPADTLAAVRWQVTQNQPSNAGDGLTRPGTSLDEFAESLADTLNPILDVKGSSSLRRHLA